MAAQIPRRQKSRSWIAWGCGIGFGLALLLILGVAAFAILKAQPGGGILTARMLSPTAEQQARLNEPVQVAAEAANRAGVSRVEVYADGALIVAQDVTGKAGAELRAIGDWIPLTVGRHALMARGYSGGYGPKHTHADSSIVYVDVLKPPDTVDVDVDSLAGCGDHPSVDSLAACLGTTPDDLVAHSPDLGGVSGSDTVPPGVHVHVPPPPGTPPETSPPPAPAPGVPAAPTGLTGRPDCTGANLHWNPSPDAQTYRVYRPTTTLGIPIADGLRDTSYWDTSVPRPGTYQYAVASVHDGQEGPPSAMFTASTPEDCPVFGFAPGTATDLVLKLAMIHTNEAFPMGLQCYLSVNGSPFQHAPDGSFNTLPPGGSDAHYYSLTTLPNGGRLDLSGWPLTSPVTMNGHCQGVTPPDGPGSSPELGSFSVSEPSDHWDGRLLTANTGGFQFSYCLGPWTQPCTAPTPGESPSQDTIVNTGGVLSFSINAPTNVRHVPGMDTWPYVDQCGALPILDRIRCAAEESAVGRERITWDWEASASVPESSLTSYTVQRKDLSTTETTSWDVTLRTGPGGTLPKRFFSSDSDLCSGSVEYRVQANSGDDHSEWGAVSFPTTRCAEAADVTVTFDTLQLLGPLNDLNESVFFSDDKLEVYGSIYAYGPGMSPDFVDIQPMCGISLGAGGYQWSAQDLTIVGPEEEAAHGAGRNVFRGRITDNTQPIDFGVTLWEADSSTGICAASQVNLAPWLNPARTTVGPYSLHDWSTFHQTYTFRGGTPVDRGGEGEILVTVRVDGAPAP